MRRSRYAIHPISFAAMLAVAGCSDRGAEVATPRTEVGDLAPTPPVPLTNLHVHIHSEDPDASAALDYAEARFDDVVEQRFAPIVAYLRWIGRAQWRSAGASCSAWDFDIGACRLSYEVCRDGDVFAWHATESSGCNGSESEPLSVLEATTTDEASGRAELRPSAGDDVTLAWEWSTNGTDRVWSVHDGPTDSTPSIGTWTAYRDDVLELITWEEPGVRRYEYEGVDTGVDGEVLFYAWSGDDWALEDRISWKRDLSGEWVTYAPDGSPLVIRDW